MQSFFEFTWDKDSKAECLCVCVLRHFVVVSKGGDTLTRCETQSRDDPPVDIYKPPNWITS